MPAPPECAQVRGQVRAAKILRQHQPEQQSNADRHFGIGGEIQEQLERERKRRGPRFAEIEHLGGGLRKQRVDHAGEMIGQHHLFGEPQGKQQQSGTDPLPQARPQRIVIKLRNQFIVADDRSSDQVREQENEKRELAQRIERCLLAPPVDQVGDELEREEADADRQHDVGPRERQAGRRGQDPDQKIGILEGA